jgi:hypothetical protein
VVNVVKIEAPTATCAPSQRWLAAASKTHSRGFRGLKKIALECLSEESRRPVAYKKLYTPGLLAVPILPRSFSTSFTASFE